MKNTPDFTLSGIIIHISVTIKMVRHAYQEINYKKKNQNGHGDR